MIAPPLARVLPPSAAQALRDTQNLEGLPRRVALEQVTKRIKQQHPQHFRKEL